MHLYEEILSKEIGRLMLETLSSSHIDCAEIVNSKSIKALQKIKAIVLDDGLRWC